MHAECVSVISNNYPVTPDWSEFINHGKIASMRSIPFWYAKRPMNAMMGTLASSRTVCVCVCVCMSE